MKKIMQEYKGKKVAVIGMAKSGIAAANLAVSAGADVLISDISKSAKLPKGFKLSRKVKIELGKHSGLILDSNLIIKSPGIHNDLQIILQARKKGITVWGENEFASRFITPNNLIAITGTNGKTTTTALVGEIIKSANPKTVVGGNIGTPLAMLVPKITDKTDVVLEVSSYQLDDSVSFHPNIAAILNITPDHLEHHGSMKNYAKAKARIYMNQTKNDHCIFNYDEPITRRLAKGCPANTVFFSRKKKLSRGVYYSQGKIFVNLSNNKFSFPAKFKIPGMHNIENILAAVAIAVCSGVPQKKIESVTSSFPGVEHRIEFVRSVRGVKYYNDSKGTNVDSTRVALDSLNEPVWLILGGRDKGAPYAPLIPLIKRKVRGILTIGEATPIIKKQLSKTVQLYDCGTLRSALRLVVSRAVAGDSVLLSPACASFDQFKNFEHRGRVFKTLVMELS